jgi:hypothetical protein
LRSGNKIYLMALVLTLALLGAPNLACDRQSGPTITVGRTEIKLLEPQGLIRIDESHPQYLEVTKSLLQEPGTRVSALYVDPVIWEAYLDGLGPEGPSVPLDFYAAMLTFEILDDMDINLKQFAAGIKEGSLAGFSARGAEVLADQPRYYTIRLGQADPDSGAEIRQVNSALVVNRKVLVLITDSWADSRHRQRAEDIALNWRDAYLKQTQP